MVFQVISVHDCRTLYDVPLLLQEQNIIQIISEKLQLGVHVSSRNALSKWQALSQRFVELFGKVIKDFRVNRGEDC